MFYNFATGHRFALLISTAGKRISCSFSSARCETTSFFSFFQCLSLNGTAPGWISCTTCVFQLYRHNTTSYSNSTADFGYCSFALSKISWQMINISRYSLFIDSDEADVSFSAYFGTSEKCGADAVVLLSSGVVLTNTGE